MKNKFFFVQFKNKLKREDAFSRINTAKINEQWRFILRKIKCKELYEDVEYLWKNFVQSVNAKDAVINYLCEQLEIADMDHRRLQEGHIDIIDTLIGKKKKNSKTIFLFFKFRYFQKIYIYNFSSERQRTFGSFAKNLYSIAE